MKFENLRIKEIDFVIKYTPREHIFDVKNRTNHIVGIQTKGKAEHSFSDGTNFTIRENNLYFLNCKDDYSVKVLNPTQAFSVHFTTYEPIETNSFCVEIKTPSEVLRFLESVEREYLTRRDELRMISDFYMLCSLIDKMRRKIFSPTDERMLCARDYICLHFAEKTCIADAVLQSGVTRRRFNSLFKSNFDISPNIYLGKIRTDYAKKLLETEQLKIFEVAALCGFADTFYFSRCFKKAVGVTPSDYRKRLH